MPDRKDLITFGVNVTAVIVGVILANAVVMPYVISPMLNKSKVAAPMAS